MSLIKFELKKISKNRLLVVGFIFLVLFVFATINVKLFGDVFGRCSVKDEMDVAKKYEGELSDQKIMTILNEYGEQLKNSNKGWNQFQGSVVDKFVNVSEYDIYTRDNDKEQSFSIDSKYVKTMKEVGYDTTNNSIKLGNFVTWTELYRVVEVVFIPIVLMAIYFCATLFSSERTPDMLPLLFSTEKGRTRMILCKLLFGFIGSIGIFLVVQVAIFICYYGLFGIVGWDTSIQANLMWNVAGFSENWNLLQVYLFTIIIQGVELLFVCGITLFISSVCHTTFSSLAVSLGLFFLPKALTQLLPVGVIGDTLNYLPINFFSPETLLNRVNKSGLLGIHSLIMTVFTLVLIYFVATCVIAGINCFRMRHVQIS